MSRRFFWGGCPITYYLLGAYISQYRLSISKPTGAILLLVWLLAIITSSFFYVDGGIFNWQLLATSGQGYQMFSVAMLSSMILLLLKDITIKSGWLVYILEKVSNCSFEIYIFSQRFDSLIYRSFIHTPFLSYAKWMPVTVILSFVLSAAAGIVFKQLWRVASKKLRLKRGH